MSERKCDVLIVGGGFGGALAAHRLERILGGRRSEIHLVAPTNFMLFSPLLAEAASGTIEPRHAVIPLRELLRRTDVEVGEVTRFDPAEHTASIRDLNGEHHGVEFKAALLAPGSVPATAPVPGLVEHAVGFKTLADAIWLRNRVLHQLDAAESTEHPQRRSELLTFTFVGGGYAGVEALAELESLSRDALRRYPDMSPIDLRWVIVEAEDSLLPGLHPRLASYTHRNLERRGVEVHLNTRMTDCSGKTVTLSDDTEPYRSATIVWTAGQRPAPLAVDWDLPTDDHGFVPVDYEMRVRGLTDIYAVGDFAAVPDPEGGISPNTAQHAMRQGHVAASNIAAGLGFGSPKTYTYRNRGLAVTLGKRQGTAQVKKLTFTGVIAWWMGRSYHLLMMPGWGRRARVVTDWTLSLVFPRDVAQLGQLGTPSGFGD